MCRFAVGLLCNLDCPDFLDSLDSREDCDLGDAAGCSLENFSREGVVSTGGGAGNSLDTVVDGFLADAGGDGNGCSSRDCLENI